MAGCFATQALLDGEPVAGRAHVSGIAVAPDRWGEGLAHAVLHRLNELLLELATTQHSCTCSRPTSALEPCTSTSDGASFAPVNLTQKGPMPSTRRRWASEPKNGYGYGLMSQNAGGSKQSAIPMCRGRTD